MKPWWLNRNWLIITGGIIALQVRTIQWLCQSRSRTLFAWLGKSATVQYLPLEALRGRASSIKLFCYIITLDTLRSLAPARAAANPPPPPPPPRPPPPLGRGGGGGGPAAGGPEGGGPGGGGMPEAGGGPGGGGGAGGGGTPPGGAGGAGTKK